MILSNLNKPSYPQHPFLGALDLAAYAKECHVVATARCSLADVCAAVLGKGLKKHVSEQMSAAWENVTLSSKQLSYAADDVYAPLMAYEKLSKLTVPKPLPSEPIPMTPVLLYNTDNTVLIASGHISSHLNAEDINGVKIGRIHTGVNISKVYIPAAIISNHHKQVLKSFRPPPFSVVCLHNHLRVYDPLSSHLPATNSDAINRQPTDVDIVMEPITAPNIGIVADEDGDSVASDDDEPPEGVGHLLHDAPNMIGSTELETDVISSLKEVDCDSQAFGQQIFSTLRNLETWDDTLWSRVLKDVFHVFNMLHLSTSHTLRKEFGWALCNAIFVPDQEDQM